MFDCLTKYRHLLTALTELLNDCMNICRMLSMITCHFMNAQVTHAVGYSN